MTATARPRPQAREVAAQKAAIDEPVGAVAGGGEEADDGDRLAPRRDQLPEPCWAVLDLFIASARGLALTALEHRQLAQMRAARTVQTPESLTG